jgi:hypothetical protein
MEFAMMLKGQTSRTILYSIFLALDIFIFTQLIAIYPAGTAGLARARQFQPAPVSAPVAGDEPGIVQSVYVEGTLDLPVVQQPEENTNYVSPNKGELTQFAAVSQYGNIGLLAHNYLSGKAFSHLVIGQHVRIQYSSGETESFVITEILSYQALDPKSPYSSFKSLKNETEILSVGQMFDRVYRGERHLTFQTCIANGGMASWGRLFVVAEPKPAVASLDAGILQTSVSYVRP